LTSTTVQSVELTGRMVHPSDTDYQIACAGWNLLFAHAPMVIVSAREVEDVVHAIIWPRQNKVVLPVREGPLPRGVGRTAGVRMRLARCSTSLRPAPSSTEIPSKKHAPGARSSGRMSRTMWIRNVLSLLRPRATGSPTR
jgi:hypothetical protein